MAPAALLHWVQSYYHKDAENALPVIPPQGAAILSVAYTLIYVLPFYFSSATRPSPSLSRDAPSVIRARIRAVTFSGALSATATFYLILYCGKVTPWEALRLLGWWPIAPAEIAQSLLLTALLFTGPLFERGIAEGEWKDWVRGRRVSETLRGWIGWRNFVAGPITEEVVFRSSIIPLHLLAKISPAYIVFLTPLYFGIAHIHHFYEYKLTHPHTPLLPALFRSLFQFTYTTIFGWYAAFVFLRTGSLLAVIFAHSFCNWCGLPRLWGRVEAGASGVEPSVVTRGKEDDQTSESKGSEEGVEDDGTMAVGWTVAYYVLLVAGAVAFFQNLWLLTDSGKGLAIFERGARP